MLSAATLLVAEPATAAVLVLPDPGGDPAAIVLSADPLLRFAHDRQPMQPFLDRLSEAVARHPSVSAAVAQVQAAHGVRAQVRAALLPQVDAQLVAGRQLARKFGSRDTIIESLQPRGRTDALLTGDQLLFDWGATARRIAAADARTAAARAEVEQTATATALGAAAAWSDALAADNLVALTAGAEARQRAILGQVRDRVTQGLGTGGDTARAEAVLAEARAAVARAERLAGGARARFREAFGDAPPPRLARPLAPGSQAVSSDAAAALAHRSPPVVAALKRAAAADRDAAAVRADGRPRLSAGIAATRYDVFAGSDYEVRGQLTLRQSLSAGGRQRGAVAEAQARARAAANDADRDTALAERDAATAFTDVAALTRTTAALEDRYIADRRARDAYAEQFRVSRGTLIELLRIEQDFQASATALVEAVAELDVARFALLARTGELLPATGIRISVEGNP